MAKEDGYIILARGVLDHPFLDRGEFDFRSAWIWLLQEAAWRDHERVVNGQPVTLLRGQLFHSLRFIADAWKWDKMRVSRFLDGLKKRDMISVKTETHGSTITISNYSSFQDASNWSRDTNETRARHQRDTDETDEKEGKGREYISSLRSDIAQADQSADLFGQQQPTPAVKPKAPRKKAASAMTKDWQISDELWHACLDILRKAGRADIKLEEVADEFRDYWIGTGKLMVNWDAAFRNRVRDQCKRPPARANGRAHPQRPMNALEALRASIEEDEISSSGLRN